MKKKLLFLLPLFLLTGCNNGSNSNTKKDDITITLNESNITIQVEQTFDLTATVLGSEKEVNWSTSNAAVANVSGGVVTGLNRGECDIIASIEKAKATCHVIVVPMDEAVYEIQSPSFYSVELGKETTIETEVHCFEGEDETTVQLDVSYSSSDENVFTVNGNKIVPVAPGTGYVVMASEKTEKRVEVTVYDKFINTTADYLEMIADRTYQKRYFLNADLDFTGIAYTGASQVLSYDKNETFKGIFEGNGHSIKNVTIPCSSSTYTSLFGNVTDAVIKNVNITGLKFTNVNQAAGVSALFNNISGFNTVVQNVNVDVNFDATTANESSKRYILFNGYKASLDVLECPYYISLSNILVNASFASKAPITLGFVTAGASTNKEMKNIYIYSGFNMKNNNTSIKVNESFSDLVYTLNSQKPFGDVWQYSLNELVFPSVKTNSHTLTDTLLTTVNGNQELKNYEVVKDFPFAKGFYGRAYGDYATTTSRVTSQFVTSWHAFGGNIPCPFEDVNLSEYNSLVFFVKCPEKKTITVKTSTGKQADVLAYNPGCSEAWKKIEFMNNGTGTWTVKFDGVSLDSSYKYTNLNDFDFCFNPNRFYVSELFGLNK